MDNNHYVRLANFDAVMVSPHDDGAIWMTVVVERARASVIMTREQAQELIAALEQVLA